MDLKSLDKLLLDRKRLDLVFDKLRIRTKGDRSLLYRKGMTRNITLSWILMNQDLITKVILDAVRTNNYNYCGQKQLKIITNKERIIYVTNWIDKILLMHIYQILTEYLNPHFSEDLYSFQKGKSTFMALKNAQHFVTRNLHENIYVLQADVSSYGDNIDQEIMMKMFREDSVLNNSPKLLDLIYNSFRVETSSTVEGTEPFCLIRGIPSGSPLVPVLENFYLSKLDLELQSNDSCFYGRYGDDIIYLAKSMAKIKKADLIIEKQMRLLNLHINPDKKHMFHLSRDIGEGNRNRLEWIGATLNCKGHLTGKESHFKQAKKDMREMINRVIIELRAVDYLTYEDRVELLKHRLHKILFLHTSSLEKLFIKKNDPKLAKVLDYNIREYIVRKISMHFRINKKEAWREVKKMKLPSLNYQRRYFYGKLK